MRVEGKREVRGEREREGGGKVENEERWEAKMNEGQREEG